MRDSVLERDRRIRNARKTMHRREPHRRTALWWLWSQLHKGFDVAQSWIVVSLVGKSFYKYEHHVLKLICLCRCLHWHQCRYHLYCEWMARRYKNRILFGRVVAESAILLLGDRGRRNWRLWIMAPVEQHYAGTLANICNFCRTCFRYQRREA